MLTYDYSIPLKSNKKFDRSLFFILYWKKYKTTGMVNFCLLKIQKCSFKNTIVLYCFKNNNILKKNIKLVYSNSGNFFFISIILNFRFIDIRIFIYYFLYSINNLFCLYNLINIIVFKKRYIYLI